MEGPFELWLEESSKLAIPSSVMVDHATVEMVFAAVGFNSMVVVENAIDASQKDTEIRSALSSSGGSVASMGLPSRPSQWSGDLVGKDECRGRRKYRTRAQQQDAVARASVK